MAKAGKQPKIRKSWGVLDPSTKIIKDKRKEMLEDELEKEIDKELRELGFITIDERTL